VGARQRQLATKTRLDHRWRLHHLRAGHADPGIALRRYRQAMRRDENEKERFGG
jgi:hypothetical protein